MGFPFSMPHLLPAEWAPIVHRLTGFVKPLLDKETITGII